MNELILVSSLRYLCDNYQTVTKLSLWINNELITNQKHRKVKLDHCFDRKDYEVFQILDKNLTIIRKKLSEFFFSSPYGIFEMLMICLKNGIHIHEKNDYIANRLCFYNYFYIFKKLFDEKIDIINESIFLDAVSFNCFEIVKLIVRSGFDIRDCYKKALTYSCKYNFYLITKVLLKHRLKTNNSFVKDAIITDNHYMIKLLIKYGSINRNNKSEMIRIAKNNNCYRVLDLIHKKV